ncbi:hypothetical protein ACRALDRAFT_1082515 [Sodiomyces alcalophilus JCM 7366]|uniref:uncharacterized protein n=1 Tax=Sodiomyces alcalophilus JCM 7366 TaxID=591952 RepID=UPI0039B3E5AC
MNTVMLKEKTVLFLSGAVGLYTLFFLLRVIYNVFFHPLRGIPGPLLHRASGGPIVAAQMTGGRSFRIQSLHAKYGPVVRIAPNHVTFTDARAFRDVYGIIKKSSPSAPPPAVPELPKADEFYRLGKSLPRDIVTEHTTRHRALRHALAPSFSEKSMREQEGLIMRYVDMLISRMRNACDEAEAEALSRNEKPAPAVLNMTEHYNWTTFDVIGDLVFGESFGCLEKGRTHGWIRAISGFLRNETRLRGLVYLGLEPLALLLFRLSILSEESMRMWKHTREKLDKRMEMDRTDIKADLFGELLKKRDHIGLDYGHLMSNSLILVLAGSETTATLLAGATYLLTTHPDVLKRVTREVRETFYSTDEINFTSASRLKYMISVLNESFRCYPPALSGLVRKVPKGGHTVAGHFIPEGTRVEVSQWAANHDPDNWADPWVFDPDRFMVSEAEALAKGNRFDALQPFSVGPRNCIGMNLAYAEMRLIMARVLFDFDMELHPESKNWIERQNEYIVWSKLPLKIRLRRAVNHGQSRDSGVEM